MNIVSAVILCTIVGAVGAIVLVAAAKFMAVEEDPRIEEVSACLAGANCGGCGYAGCSDYAKAVVLDGVPCDKCAPGGPKAAAAIAKIMGGEASAVEKKAVVQCQGSSEHCKPAYDYKGIQTCAAAAALYGGPKTCTFACIGLGDCTKVCKFDAIHIVDGVAKVDKDKCTGCGACANICPKQVIMIDAAGPRKPVVMCSNKDKGAVANKLCTTSCIACGMCERTCKFDAIHVVALFQENTPHIYAIWCISPVLDAHEGGISWVRKTKQRPLSQRWTTRKRPRSRRPIVSRKKSYARRTSPICRTVSFHGSSSTSACSTNPSTRTFPCSSA